MKLWFTLMAGPGSLEDLQELWEPIKQYFDGLVCTYHGDYGDDEAIYLETRMGEGAVIYLPYSKRHDHSRNTYLWCGPMEQGDWVVGCDTLERINPDFAAHLQYFIPQLQLAGHNCVYYHGKPLIYRYHESLRFQGSPHEGLRRDDGQMRPVDLTPAMPDESKVRLNVRPQKRPDPFHWVGHYARYYIDFPYGSNHCLLGLEKQGDVNQLFPVREEFRLQFRDELRKRGYPVTVAGAKAMFEAGLDQTLCAFLNGELILHDWYRYTILGERWMTDRHDPSSIRPITLDTKSNPAITEGSPA